MIDNKVERREIKKGDRTNNPVQRVRDESKSLLSLCYPTDI